MYLDEMELIQDVLRCTYSSSNLWRKYNWRKFFDNTDKSNDYCCIELYKIQFHKAEWCHWFFKFTDKNLNVTNSINEDIDQINDKIYQFLNNKENNKLNENNNLPNIENEAIFYFSGHVYL